MLGLRTLTTTQLHFGRYSTPRDLYGVLIFSSQIRDRCVSFCRKSHWPLPYSRNILGRRHQVIIKSSSSHHHHHHHHHRRRRHRHGHRPDRLCVQCFLVHIILHLISLKALNSSAVRVPLAAHSSASTVPLPANQRSTRPPPDLVVSAQGLRVSGLRASGFTGSFGGTHLHSPDRRS